MHGSYPESMTSSDVVDRSTGTLARLLRWALAVLAAAMAWVATAGAWVVTCTEPARSLPPTGGGNALLVWVGWAAGPFATLVVGSVAWERVRGRGGPGDRPASAHTLEPAPGVPQEHFRCTRRSLVWRAVAVLVLGGLWAAVMAQWPGAVLRVLDGELDGLGRYDLAFGLIAGPLLLVLVIAAMAAGTKHRWTRRRGIILSQPGIWVRTPGCDVGFVARDRVVALQRRPRGRRRSSWWLVGRGDARAVITGISNERHYTTSGEEHWAFMLPLGEIRAEERAACVEALTRWCPPHARRDWSVPSRTLVQEFLDR